ncbi:unnamed protein product, partial [Prorocentrum cordatum]
PSASLAEVNGQQKPNRRRRLRCSLLIPPMAMTKSEPFYLNIVVVDSSAAVTSQVQGKLGSGFFGKAASTMAKKVVTESKIATKVAAQLVEKIPAVLAEKGITLECKARYQFGSFIVLRAQVTEVTPVQLVTLAKGDAFGQKFGQMLESFEALELAEALDTVQAKVRDKVNIALIEKLTEILPAKLQEQGIQTTISAKPTHEQAEFFFDFIERMQGGEAGGDS